MASDRRSGGQRGGRRRRKVCAFCAGNLIMDYKNTAMLRQYLDDRMRIRKARQSSTCRRHQNRLAGAIKRAREMALLPYVVD